MALKSATENQQLIHQILSQFGQIISGQSHQTKHTGLLSGLTGDLLFLYKLSQYDETLVDIDVFSDKLEYLQQRLPDTMGNPFLSDGLSGQGWLLEYFNQGQDEDYDPFLCEEIDNILQQCLDIECWQGDIEMVLGLGGLAIYAARRGKKSTVTPLFDRIISHYEIQASQISDGLLVWSQPADSVYRFNKDNTLECNLGLAHGVPGIIAAILPALNIPTLQLRATSLLIQSCDWLLTQESTDPQRASCFSLSCNAQTTSRLGWCYGDLTIALTLARVGKALDCPRYIEKATQISLHSADRDPKQALVKDASLCHGSAGLALIFQLLNQQLNEPRLLASANKWLSFTLDLYRKNDLQGFNMFDGLSQEYECSTDLLMGYGGIGLCLLAAMGAEPDWVDCLLMA